MDEEKNEREHDANELERIAHTVTSSHTDCCSVVLMVFDLCFTPVAATIWADPRAKSETAIGHSNFSGVVRRPTARFEAASSRNIVDGKTSPWECIDVLTIPE